MISAYTIGVILGVLSSLCFGANRAFLSTALVSANARSTNYVAAVIGLLIALATAALLGQTTSMLSASGLVLALFVIAGVLHFGISRLFLYTAIKNIGANPVSVLSPLQVLFAFLFAVIFLGEKLNAFTFIGGSLIVAGAILVEARSGAIKRRGNIKIGVICAILPPLIYGITPVLIEKGLSTYHFFASATFLSYAGALAFNAAIISPRKATSELKSIPPAALVSIILAGIFVVMAQLLRYDALAYTQVVVVTPLVATNPVVTVLLTRLTARDVEVFHWRTILSAILAITGAILVSFYFT